MTLVTPSGYSNFSWAPKSESLTKTASTGEQKNTDKDMLYEAAAKFAKSKSEDTEKKADDAEVSVDIQKAVSALQDKADKAEDLAQKVQDAVSKVEQAVQEVKEVAGVKEEVEPTDIPGVVGDVEEVEIELEEDDEKEKAEIELPEGVEEVEIELPETDEADEADEDKAEIKEVEIELPETDEENPSALGNEVVEGHGVEKESKGCCASETSDFVKLSSVSKDTAKKITTFWKDYLGYPEDYVKLMVKNYEK